MKVRMKQGLCIGMTLVIVMVGFPKNLQATHQDYDAPIAYGIDTIAGYSALIKTQETTPNTSIEFWVKKPNGSELLIESETDDNGVAKIDLYDYHTKQAGIYQIAARFPENDFGPIQSFRIYPDEISETQSRVTVDHQTAQTNGNDAVMLTVQLLDNYGNGIADHTLTVISSRSDDVIRRVSKNPFSDGNGILRFSINSRSEGVSVYTIFDTTASKTLNERIKVAFYHSEKNIAERIGGHSEVLLAEYETTIPTNLKIENLSEIAAPNTVMTFSVAVYDEKGNPVSDYLGSVHFSSTDSNATLPHDYTFTTEDLGRHTFSLGLKFLTEGTHTLEVVDMNNVQLRGSKTISITDEITQPGDERTLIILYPTEGTYSESNLNLEGEAPVGKTVKIYDNDEEIGETMAGSDNIFRFDLKNLSEGSHSLQASLVEKTGDILESSEKINIQIDTAAPVIDEIETEPSENIPVDSDFLLRLYTEKELDSISVILDENIIPLKEDLEVSGSYSATLKSPKETGEYPLDIILVDKLGNESSFQAYKILMFIAKGPKKVTNLFAEPKEEKIILSWDPVEGGTGIDHYRIYYGTDAGNLDQTVDTFDSTTTWYIPNLMAGVTYWFTVTALDTENNESEEQSDPVRAVPLGIIYPDTVKNLKTLAGPEKMTLTWEASKDDTYINSYRIYYSTEENNLKNIVETFDFNTTWYIPNLVGGVTYYFAVTAVDSDGNESREKSDIVQGIPLPPPFPNENTSTGPGLKFILVLTLLGVEAYLLTRYAFLKKRRIKVGASDIFRIQR